MKTKWLTVLLTVSLLWAITSTILYYQLKSNPRVVAVTTDLGKNQLAQSQLSEMEKLSFVRQFIEQYGNYNSNNFWQTQTTLAFLMDSPLREKRIQEVSRLKEKIQKKNLSQQVHVKNISLNSQNIYSVQAQFTVTEEGQPSQQIHSLLQIKLNPTERTLENPWGLLIAGMDFTPQEASFDSVLWVKAQSPSVLTFPCAIENIENPAENLIETKITTLNVSEVQIVTPQGLKEETTLKAFCKNQEYSFVVKAMREEQTLFKVFPSSVAVMRKTLSSARSKDIYDKTIESVLGIKVE